MAMQAGKVIVFRKFIGRPVLVVAGQKFFSLAQQTVRRVKGQAPSASFLPDLG